MPAFKVLHFTFFDLQVQLDEIGMTTACCVMITIEALSKEEELIGEEVF